MYRFDRKFNVVPDRRTYNACYWSPDAEKYRKGDRLRPARRSSPSRDAYKLVRKARRAYERLQAAGIAS